MLEADGSSVFGGSGLDELLCAILTCRRWDTTATLQAQSRAHHSCFVAEDDAPVGQVSFRAAGIEQAGDGPPATRGSWVLERVGGCSHCHRHSHLSPLTSHHHHPQESELAPSRERVLSLNRVQLSSMPVDPRLRTSRDAHPVVHRRPCPSMRCHSKTVAHADRHVKKKACAKTPRPTRASVAQRTAGIPLHLHPQPRLRLNPTLPNDCPFTAC